MQSSEELSIDFRNYEKSFSKLKSGNKFSRLGKCFETKENKYFYDSGTGKIFQLNENVYKILECLWKTDKFEHIFELNMSTDELLEGLNEIEQAVKDEKILLIPPVKSMLCNNPTGRKLEDQQMKHISIEVTERCNLRCKYCIYNEGQGGFRGFGGKDISFEVIKKTIDLLSQSTEEEVFVSFYGGEPLIRFDLIKQCISYCNEKLVNKKVHYNMTSNCTLMTEEIANYLASLENYFTTVSLDGPEHIHNKNRVFPDGKGSFEKTVEGLKHLIKAEGDKASERINFNIVLENTDQTTFEEVQNFFRKTEWISNDIQITTSYVSTANKEYEYLGIGSDKELKMAEYIAPLTKWSFERIESGSVSIDNNTLISKDTINKEFSYIHKRVLIDEPVQSHYMNGCCIPSARRLYITVDGDFAVCERIGPSPFIGNVDTGVDLNKVKKHYIDDFEREATKYCNECWAITLCGMCYTQCYDENGINISYRHAHCMANRRLLENSLIRYHELLETNPESLDYLNKIVYS